MRARWLERLCAQNWMLLCSVFMALNVLDVLLTEAVLARGGMEVNPLLRGENWIEFKLLAASTAVVLLAWLRNRRILGALVVACGVIVAWNAVMLAACVVLESRFPIE